MTAPSPKPARPAGGKGAQILFFIAGVLVVIAVFWVIQRVRRPAAPDSAAAPASQNEPMPAQTASIPPEAVPTADEEAQIKAMPRITVAETKSALDAGTATLIDVRDAEDYLAMHATGALHIPVRYIAGEAQYLPRDKTIVFYCT